MVGSHGEVLVMDWGCGVAFGLIPQHEAVPRLEDVASIAGTPAYMVPEMVDIERHAMGPHSDVYLLGAILYELLTGTRPHRGGSLRAVLALAAAGRVEAPAQRAPGRDLPGELCDICMAALAPEPARRTATVDELLQRLRAYRGHAQAVQLAQHAERLLATVTARSDERGLAQTDDQLRQAVAAAENAVQLWPGWRTGQALAARATLTHARHSFATHGYTQAQSLAKRSVQYAGGDGAAVEAARNLYQAAKDGAAASRRRGRTMHIMRVAMVVFAILVCVVAVTAAVIVDGHRKQSEQARLRAEELNAQMVEEQARRAADQVRFAPGLVAQAKAAIASERLQEADDYLTAAMLFDPKLVEAARLRANVLAAAKRFPDAIAAAQRWQTLQPGNAEAGELIGLCTALNSGAASDRSNEQTALSGLFVRQQLPTLALQGQRSGNNRFILYQQRFNQAWPGSGALGRLSMDANGRLSSSGLANNALVVDLSPLRGMPISSLNISGTGVTDVSLLAGMPLEYLDFSLTRIRDLRPLRDCPLKGIKAMGASELDLASLAGFRLTNLAITQPRLKELTALKDMPLEGLYLNSEQDIDLSPLQGAPIRSLAVRLRISDLRGVKGLPCEEFDATGSFSDLSPLAGMPLKILRLHGNFSSLKPIAGLTFKELALTSSQAISLEGLGTCTVDTLSLKRVRFAEPVKNARLVAIRLKLNLYSGDLAFDARNIDLSRLEDLKLENSSGKNVELGRLAGQRLTHFTTVGKAELDLGPLARAPLIWISLENVSDQTWRSLAELKPLSTLREVVVQGKALPATDFWNFYDQSRNQAQ